MKIIFFAVVFCIACGITEAGPANQEARRGHTRRVLRTRKRVNDEESQLFVRDLQALTTSLANSDLERSKRSHDKWLEIIAQFARPANGGASLPWQPFPVDLPIAAGGANGPVSLPVLILPVPVPVPSLNQECSANRDIRIDSRTGVTGTSTPIIDSTQAQPTDVDYLIELFRAQEPRAPEFPPALVGQAPEIEYPRVVREYLPPSEATIPPIPRFDRPMMIRGFLIVPTSDFTESYMVWYDPSGTAATSRVDYHDEGTSAYLIVMPDGRVQRFVKHVDRTGEKDVRVCGVSPPFTPSPEDQSVPAIPDPSEYTFDGFRDEFGGRVEVWKRVVYGGDGQYGATRRESLTFNHELLVNRKADGYSVPLKYSVSIDSSVLGKDYDGYQHIYSEVRLQAPNRNKFSFNVEQECDVQEPLDPQNGDHLARLNPIREFTLPTRDTRYDIDFDKFVSEYERIFTNDKEAALRKALVIKNLRRITACNRQSLSFVTSANYLLDRLDVEVQVTFGVDYSLESDIDISQFPFTITNTSSVEKELEDEFDWRKLGGVTPVKNQGSCHSCWAFAVIASVEGALFRTTGRLVELSEQCLVDCAHSHGTKGCEGSWPSNAFRYIKERGIPARNIYAPYGAKVLQCKENEVAKETRVSGFANVPPNNINALKLAIKKEAPAVTIVDTDKLIVQFLSKGIYHDERANVGKKSKLNHAEAAVGWGTHRRETYFILKNSYGPKYAEGGYIRVHAPSNTMNVLTKPYVALL